MDTSKRYFTKVQLRFIFIIDNYVYKKSKHVIIRTQFELLKFLQLFTPAILC